MRSGAVGLALALSVGCAATTDPRPEVEEEAVSERDEPVASGTVLQAAQSSCSTGSVKGLSLQIIEEGNCIEPGAFEKLPSRPNLVVAGSHVFAYLEKPARDRLVQALDASPQKTMTVNSALRTVAQQYMLHRWSLSGKCGIGLAATPGNSNHETGLALDIQEYSSWKSALSSKGFAWLGSKDPVHFDYVGAGAVDHRGLDVLAFQRLWNRNNPGDKIAEDGDYGPATKARIEKSPAGGFPKGAQCNQVACSEHFNDICDSPHKSDIDWMADEGLTAGCDPDLGLFCPKDKLTRGVLARYLRVLLNLAEGPDAFTDDTGSPFEADINALAAAGITTGCGGGKYCPTAVVTRGELAILLQSAFAFPAGPNAFSDDAGTAWESAANALAAANVTSGCGGGKYCGTGEVTREVVASFLHRAWDASQD